MLIAGIEEAGRGPVIGPMIICGVLIKEENTKKLMEAGVKDSKMLSPQRRNELVPKIKEIAEQVYSTEISPEEIDKRNENNLNLNDLEAIEMAKIIDKLKPEKAVIDCPSTNIESFKKQLESLSKHKCKMIVEHKADVNYPVVSAASIIAKVTRDSEISKLERSLNVKIGSGYPADPITQKFIEKNWDKLSKLPFIRNSWDTIKSLKAKKGQMNISKYF